MSKNMLLFGESCNFERGLHFFECGIAFFGRFRLVELHESDKEFCFVLAESESRGDFWNALVRKILAAAHDSADKILRLESDFIRKHAKRKGGVLLLFAVVIVPQKFPVIQVFEDLACRFFVAHVLNVRKKIASEKKYFTLALSRNNDYFDARFKEF